jgi:cytochrome c oxidase assembly protein subunit 15
MHETMENGALTTVPSRWVHRWAVLTVGATVVLLGLGSIVTTFRVGMADPIWPTYPWHLLLISWEEPSPGFLIEHTHRLAGYIVGCCVIVLALSLWWGETRRWLRWLGMVALLGVIAQGLLGGFRVKLNALVGTDLALIHGCFAQVVFALLVSLALFTSRGWTTAALPATGTPEMARLRCWSLWLTGLVFVQLVLGAAVRHMHSALGQRAHVLAAFAVVAVMAWLAKTVWDRSAPERFLMNIMKFLAVLIVFQLLLGVEAWTLKFASGGLPEAQAVTARQALVRTAHVLIGSWILATSVVVTLCTHRQAVPALNLHIPASPERRLEAAL